MNTSPERENNFDLLRLVFASSVLFWHLFVLSRAPAMEVFSLVFSASIGVKGFFVISGYLVMMSYERSSSLRDYAEKRLRRIYPAYAAVVVASALAGSVLTTLSPAEYFSAEVLRYLGANLIFLNFIAPNLPGVFAGQAYTEVNGALWTLKIEVMYYAFVPVLAWLMVRFGRWRTLIGCYALAAAYSAVMVEMHRRTSADIWLQLQRQLPGQLGYFLIGAGLYLGRNAIDAARWRVLVLLSLPICLAVSVFEVPLVTVLFEPAALGILVIYAATVVRHLGNFARYGDFSYGVYIIHFPVIQALVAYGVFAQAPWIAFAATLILVTALSALSWHAIERPCLKRQSHYRLAEARGG